MGTVDEDSIVGSLPKLSEHIFLQSKASWWQLSEDDGLQRYKDFPEGFQEVLDRWLEKESSKA